MDVGVHLHDPSASYLQREPSVTTGLEAGIDLLGYVQNRDGMNQMSPYYLLKKERAQLNSLCIIVSVFS